MTKYVLFGILTFLMSSAGVLADQKVVGFRVWKHKRLAEARSVFSNLSTEIRKVSRTKIEASRKAEKLQDLNQRLEQARLNVEIAAELTPNDYFVLYLSENFRAEPQVFKRAAEQMSNDEVSQVFQSYHKFLARDVDSRTAASALLGLKNELTVSRPSKVDRSRN